MSIGRPSILEQEDDLKGLPTQALQEMLRRPSGRVHPYLVAAELNFREEQIAEQTGREAAAKTAQQPATVAAGLAGMQQPIPMSQIGAMAAPPQQPPMPQEAQIAMALSGATGRPPPQLPTVNMQRGTSGAAVAALVEAMRAKGTRTASQMPAHQPFASERRPPPVSNRGLAALIAAIIEQQSERPGAYGGFDISEEVRLPQGRGGARAAARPVTAANGTQGRTVYAQTGFPQLPPLTQAQALEAARLGVNPQVFAQRLRSDQANAASRAAGGDFFGGIENLLRGNGRDDVITAPVVPSAVPSRPIPGDRRPAGAPGDDQRQTELIKEAIRNINERFPLPSSETVAQPPRVGPPAPSQKPPESAQLGGVAYDPNLILEQLRRGGRYDVSAPVPYPPEPFPFTEGFLPPSVGYTSQPKVEARLAELAAQPHQILPPDATLTTDIIVPGPTPSDDKKTVKEVSPVIPGYTGVNQKSASTITLKGVPVDGAAAIGVDRESIQSQILNILGGVTTGPAEKVDVTAVAEKARAAGDVMRESLGKETTSLIETQHKALDKIAAADKASLKKIDESFTALKDFQETGRLPQKHRDALINAGLMEFGAALLDPNNPDLYGAFSAGLKGFKEVEKGKRKEYLEGLKFALTTETAQQKLSMERRDAEGVARRSLAQFQVAQQSRDEAAAAAAEKRYTDATNDARRFEIMERTAATGTLSALAAMLNAIKPDKDARMFNMLLKGKLEEAQALAEQGDVKLLNEAFIYDEKTHQATPKMGYFVDLWIKMSGADLRSLLSFRADARGQEAQARARRLETRSIQTAAIAKADKLIAYPQSPLWKKILGYDITSKEGWPDEFKKNKSDLYEKALQYFSGDQGQSRDRLGLIADGSLPSKPGG